MAPHESWSVVKDVMEKRPLSDFKGQTATIDGAYYLCKGFSKGGTNVAIASCLNLNRQLTLNGIRTIWVFDGDTPPSKQETVDARRAAKAKYTTAKPRVRKKEFPRDYYGMEKSVEDEEGDSEVTIPEPVIPFNRVSSSEGLKKELSALKSSWVQAPLEGDHEMVKLQRLGIAQIIISPDGDLIFHGATNVITKIEGDTCSFFKREMFEMGWGAPFEDTLAKVMASFIGSDYFPRGMHGVGIITAVDIYNACAGEKYSVKEILDVAKEFTSREQDPDLLERTQISVDSYNHQAVYNPLLNVIEPLQAYEVGRENEDYSHVGSKISLDDKKWMYSAWKFGTSEEFILPSASVLINFRCRIRGCMESFISKAEYDLHVKKAHALVCGICSKEFPPTNFFLYSNHLKTHDPSNISRCHLCHTTYANAYQLHLHVKFYHLKEKLICEVCHRRVAPKRMPEHMSSHTDPKKKRRRQKHACPQCDKVCRDNNKLVLHMQKHHGLIPQKKRKCFHCSLEFASLAEVTRHERDFHAEKFSEPFPCPSCPQVFDDGPLLTAHKLVCNGLDRIFKCPKCTKEYPTKPGLNQHILQVHTNLEQKRFSCHVCNKVFANKKNFDDHQLTHKPKTGELRCNVCGVTFSLPRGLRKHIQLNRCKGKPSPVKPLQCLKCGSRFKTPRGLKEHARFKRCKGENAEH